MPRGVRDPVRTLETKLMDLDKRIVTHQNKINELNAEKKNLLQSKERAEMEVLYQMVKQSGKSPTELITHLTQATM